MSEQAVQEPPPCAEDELTSQQRAVRVVEMLRVRPRKAIELAAEIGVSRRHIYRMLDTLSASDSGIAITNYGGTWYLLPADDMRALRDLLGRLSAALNRSVVGDMYTSFGMLKRTETALLVRFMRQMLPPGAPL